MLIHLIRNQSKGAAITGRLVINGRWFCNTLERVGYQIPALCYHIAVTHSPKFKRLLPIVLNVPRVPPVFTSDSAHEYRDSDTRSGGNGLRSTESECREHEEINKISAPSGQGALRTGIRFHRGSKPEHSTGCILLPADKEIELTNLLSSIQNHEEIILEVSDYRPGTEYGYNTPCPPELQKR
jgi:cellulose synthase/poly-beta-1,6-N-acetylglucosamine synthase-like glycosyltransferase